MKHVILLLCALCFVLTVFFCSCGFFGDQQYFCEADKVESVQIVKLDKYVEGEYRFEYTVLWQITDCTVFVEQLNNLKHSVNWGEPSVLEVNYIVIKINYFNGDYDLLYNNAQWFHRSGVNQTGYFFFDNNQFDALISDYLSEANTP